MVKSMTNTYNFLNTLPVEVNWYKLNNSSCIYIETESSGFVLNTDLSQYIFHVSLMQKGNQLSTNILSTKMVGKIMDNDGDVYFFDVPYHGELLKEFIVEFKVHTGISIEIKKVVDALDAGWTLWKL